MRMAAAKCAIPFQNGVDAGLLLQPSGLPGRWSWPCRAGTQPACLMGAFLPVCYFVLCGFEHCVANMYYIAAGLMAKMVPAYAQLAAEAGLDLSGLTVGGPAGKPAPRSRLGTSWRRGAGGLPVVLLPPEKLTAYWHRKRLWEMIERPSPTAVFSTGLVSRFFELSQVLRRPFLQNKPGGPLSTGPFSGG